MSSTFDPSIFPARWHERHARQTLAAWRASGLSVRAFGARHGVQEKRLHRWFRELGAWPSPKPRASRSSPKPRASRSSLPAPAFVELVVPESARPPQREPFVIELDGVTVRVPPCFEPAALSELLGVLRC